MRRFVVFILIGIVLSVTAFADKKPKKSKKNQAADTTIVTEPKTDSVKMSRSDCLKLTSDSLLLQLKSGSEIFTPHVDALMGHLMKEDSNQADKATLLQFTQKIVSDLRPIPLKQDSMRRLLVKWIEIQRDISDIQRVLSSSYDATKLEMANQTLQQLNLNCKGTALEEQIEFLKKGVKYYKNKMAVRRVGDIIDELYELRADSILPKDSALVADSTSTAGIDKMARRDSLYNEIVGHQGRNHLIDYVPYAASLRKKVIEAFPFDSEQHVMLEQAHWDVIEAIRKEIASIISNK